MSKPAPSPAERCACGHVKGNHATGRGMCYSVGGHCQCLTFAPRPEAASEASAKRMDDAEFERLAEELVMLIPPVTLVEKYRDTIHVRPQADTKIIAEARRARESEERLETERKAVSWDFDVNLAKIAALKKTLRDVLDFNPDSYERIITVLERTK
jgi:hypothetical protein